MIADGQAEWNSWKGRLKEAPKDFFPGETKKTIVVFFKRRHTLENKDLRIPDFFSKNNFINKNPLERQGSLAFRL